MLLRNAAGRACGTARSHTCRFPPRQPHRLVPRAAPSSYGSGYDGIESRGGKSSKLPTQPDGLLDAPSTVRSIIDVLAENDLDGLIPYIPDEVLDVILAQRKLRG